MSDFKALIILAAISIAFFLITYVFSSVTYKISDNYLFLKWKIFKYLPISWKKIKLDNIQDIRTFDAFHDFGISIQCFGRFIPWNALTIEFRKRKWLTKRVVVAPDNLDQFVEEIDKIINADKWEKS